MFAGCINISPPEACYWNESGTTIVLDKPAGSLSSRATGIAISGSTILVIGFYVDPAPTKYPCVWNDGARADVTSPIVPDKLTAIAVSGSDVYVAGVCTLGGFPRPTPGYWKNDVWNALKIEDGVFNSVSAIALSGTDVFFAGQRDKISETTKGCFWSGDVRVDLAGVDQSGIVPVYGIAVK